MSRPAESRAAAFFLLAAGGAIGLGVAYTRDAGGRWQGLALLVTLGGLALGLVTWANHLMPPGPYTEEREPLPSGEAEADKTADAFEAGALVARRTLLVRSLMVAGAATGAAALFPLRSLGPRPGRKLGGTPWKAGVRAVTDDGRPVLARDVPLEGLVTAFPEGHPGSADGQVALLRVGPGLIVPQPGRAAWTPDDLVAYSRVCTHAGCPVGLYEADRHQLLCPCHQSAFDVLHGARPVFGPAAAPLPQLPLAVDADGFVVATGDFSDPVGPAYWHRER
jgi:ubiquinol-cytochrome c reductase iron-sulfur subunit